MEGDVSRETLGGRRSGTKSKGHASVRCEAQSLPRFRFLVFDDRRTGRRPLA